MTGSALSPFLTNWTSQARKGFLELIVMSLLGQREFYGYELVEQIRSLGDIEVSDGTLYTVLARLQKEGFLHHRWEQLEKGPARKYYALSPQGKDALKDMHGVWGDMARALKRSERGDV